MDREELFAHGNVGLELRQYIQQLRVFHIALDHDRRRA
jgi:hypothetical protein